MQISNKILIVLSILIRCSLSVKSMANETLNGMIFTSNDLQCLAETPFSDLMKIQKAIRMMHVVSAYDAQKWSNSTALQIDNQIPNQSDTLLRELPMAEERTVFQYFQQYKTSTIKPQSEPFMMSSQVHDAMRHNQIT